MLKSLFLSALLITQSLATPVSLAETNALGKRTTAGTIYTKCTQSGVLGMAFDDGPGQYMQQLITTLNNAGAKATFFVTGTLYGCIYNRKTWVQAAIAGGHQIGSHTWSHPSNFGSLTSAQLTTEMQKLETALFNIIGKKPTYMRPPYLATGGAVQSTMGSLGYRIITDDLDSGDWNGYTQAQSQAVFNAASTSGGGHITLMHETIQSTVTQLVPWVLSWAQSRGLKVVTVAQCLGDSNPYVSGSGNGATTC
ncbi:hypothetical protein H072_4209 [Dactylellina haptotyla CBS 200.50]|uniref:NodB homology domain-containing protein n=1 Tax=Dactylellina haptotyla (strain CBS 200.50) TaxID=1284197 RepID=S8C2I2_DACHA|nr:hypothetical protein H072_4209 [Dactylellina haptotyla CBS 200.50]